MSGSKLPLKSTVPPPCKSNPPAGGQLFFHLQLAGWGGPAGRAGKGAKWAISWLCPARKEHTQTITAVWINNYRKYILLRPVSFLTVSEIENRQFPQLVTFPRELQMSRLSVPRRAPASTTRAVIL